MAVRVSKIEIINEESIKYCVIGFDNNIYDFTLSGWRKGCEDRWLSMWENKLWKHWYKQWWRIKKVKVTVKEI